MSRNPNRRTEVRKPAAVLLGTLVALLCFGAVASATSSKGSKGYIKPIKVSASVFPPHQIFKPPYTFTVSGRITFNPYVCPPGEKPPPPGTTNTCIIVTAKQACYGKVSLYVALGRDPILLLARHRIFGTYGKVSGKCTYSISTTFPKPKFTATKFYFPHEFGSYIFVAFHVRFGGNAVLKAKSARTQYVVAKLIQP
jgi:hypothetical protein